MAPRPRIALSLAAALAVAILLAAAVAAAKAPPLLPRAVGHGTVSVVARGVPTPTQFAVFAGKLFVAGYGNEQNSDARGGVYLLEDGKAIKIKGSPRHVFGIAATKDTLYLSTSQALIAWRDWNGTLFEKRRIIKTPPFYGQFRDPAIGPDGLIYVGGVTWGFPPTPTSNSSLLAVNPATGSAETIATGIRQPWQPLFLPGHALPLLSILNEEGLGPKWPPDYIAAIKRGDNYGFPECPRHPRTCSNYTQPLVKLPAHSSPMGLAYMDGKVYIALYGGIGKGPVVAWMPPKGGKLTPVISGFPAGVIALGTVGRYLYSGDQTGAIYRVKL